MPVYHLLARRVIKGPWIWQRGSRLIDARFTADTKTWRSRFATCCECYQPVFFDQVGAHSFFAVCSGDPEHGICPAALLVLDELRRVNRPR